MFFSKMLKNRSLVPVELQAASQGRRSPPNVGTGAVTAALLAGELINYIGSGFPRRSWSRAVPHEQGSGEVGLAIDSCFYNGVSICRVDTSLYNVLNGITFLFIVVVITILVINNDAVLVLFAFMIRCGIFIHLSLDDLLNEMVIIAIISKELADPVELSMNFRPITAMGQCPIHIRSSN